MLDTRELYEYNVSHLTNARCVGYDKFTMNSIRDIPQDAEIVVYCSLGVRSEKIGERLTKAGYTNVKNLFGGIFEWVYNDFEIIDKNGKKTNRIHTFDSNWSQWLLKGEKVY